MSDQPPETEPSHLLLVGCIALLCTLFFAWGLLRAPPRTISLLGRRLPLVYWLRHDLTQPRKQPKILLFTYGTRGDVQPIVAVALALVAKDLQAVIVAPDCYRRFVESFHVQFESIGLDAVQQPDKVFADSSTMFSHVLDVLGDVYSPLCHGVLSAASRHRDASLFVSTTFTRSIIQIVANKFNKPSCAIHFAPADHPTASFPPHGFRPSRFGFFNKAKHHWNTLCIIRRALQINLHVRENQFRELVGIRAPTLLETLSVAKNEPTISAFSKSVLACPSDYPSSNFQTGYCRLSSELQTRSFTPSKELVNFLEAAERSGSPIIYITFSSMAQVANVVEAVVEILCDLYPECKILVSRPPEGEGPVAARFVTRHQNIFETGPIPHAWLFPRCALVVHHGGAGTTAEALHNGTPAVVIPIFQWSDQKAWARVLERINVGTHISKQQVLCRSDTARSKFKNVLDNLTTLRTSAQSVATTLAKEHGAEDVADVLTSYVDAVSIHLRKHHPHA